MFGLQYDGRSAERFGLLVRMWNLGSLRGKGGEVCEDVRRRMVDVCCLLEVRWRGQGARMLGMKERRYEMCWSGKGDGVGGVGVMVKEELCEKMAEVGRVSDRVKTVVVFEDDVLRLVCGYASQSGRRLEEEQSFYDELKCEWDMHSAGDLVKCLGDMLGGHVCMYIDGCDGVHGGYSVGHRNLEERMLGDILNG